MLSELSKMENFGKVRFDKFARCQRRKCDKLFVGLLAFGKDEEYS